MIEGVLSMEILVIGNGLAGLSAAIEGAKRGAKVTLVSQNTADRSQSVMAEGGINAALNTKGEEDSTTLHGEETFAAACGLVSECAVKNMTMAAPSIINYLSQIGVVFARDAQGNADVRAFGGQSKKRTVYSKAGIGRQLVTTMAQEVRKYAAQGNIILKEHHRFVELILKPAEEQAEYTREKQILEDTKNLCIGAIIQDIHTGKFEALISDSVIMATGGLNVLFGETTGSYLSNGIATATAFKQGAKLANLEMIQYHPTTMVRGEKRILISEAARGEGGRLFVYKKHETSSQGDEQAGMSEKWYFMEEMYPERGNLMPRDIVSQTIDKVSKEYGQVYLDLTHISPQVLEINLKEVCDTCRTFFNIEPSKEYIPVSPGVHYFMGGFYVDEGHRCSVRNLYAVGECASQYHGANRLGGNSTLGAIYGGIKAVESVFLDNTRQGLDNEEVHHIYEKNKYANSYLKEYNLKVDLMMTQDDERMLQSILKKSMGITRDEEVLQAGLDALRNLNITETKGVGVLAEAMILSAIERKESRGAHQRSDYSNRDDENFLKVMVASCDDMGNVRIEAKDINYI